MAALSNSILPALAASPFDDLIVASLVNPRRPKRIDWVARYQEARPEQMIYYSPHFDEWIVQKFDEQGKSMLVRRGFKHPRELEEWIQKELSGNPRKRERPTRAFGYELDPKTLTPLRKTVERISGQDYGADPLGADRFRMVPSGDIVDLEERNRRLERGNPTEWPKVYRTKAEAKAAWYDSAPGRNDRATYVRVLGGWKIVEGNPKGPNLYGVGKGLLSSGMSFASEADPVHWPERGLDLHMKDGFWFYRRPGQSWFRVTDPQFAHEIDDAFRSGFANPKRGGRPRGPVIILEPKSEAQIRSYVDAWWSRAPMARAIYGTKAEALKQIRRQFKKEKGRQGNPLNALKAARVEKHYHRLSAANPCHYRVVRRFTIS